MKKNVLFSMLLFMVMTWMSMGSLLAQTYTVDFEEQSKSGYASGTVVLGTGNDTISWNMTDVMIGDLDADCKIDQKAARLRGYATSAMTMLRNKPGGIGSLSFQYCRYGTDNQVEWKVEWSDDEGATWTQIATFTATDETQIFSYDLNQENARIRIIFNGTGSGNRRMNIDNIVMTDYMASNVVATPIFTPAAGTYSSPQSVVITTATEDATIYYTQDGTEPTTASTLYTSAITVSTTTTLKAIAIKDGLDNSEIVEAEYVINTNKGIVINSPVADTTYYTTDSFIADFSFENFIFGTDGYLKIDASFLPLLEMPNPLYCESTEMLELFLSTPLSLPEGDYSVTASLVTLDLADFDPIVSETVNFSFVTPTVTTPIFTPTAGTYYSTQSVTIATETEDAQIYYTTNGDEPTTESTLYSEAISINESTTLKAIAVKSGYTNSEIAVAEYVITTGPLAQVLLRPTHIDLTSTTSESAVLMNISGYNADALPRYRLYNGSNQYNCWDAVTEEYVTTSSYDAGPVVSGDVSGGTTFWILLQRGNNATGAASYRDRVAPAYGSNYQTTALPAAASITASFELSGRFSGTTEYDNSQKYVVLAFSGTDLISAAATVLSDGAFAVVCPEGTTIDKIEIRTVDNIPVISEIGTWTETVDLGSIPNNETQVSAPIFTPAAGTYSSPQSVVITTATEDATIYYTTDGTEPTIASTLYTSAITVNTTTTLKAIAIKDGLDNSEIVEAEYVINTNKGIVINSPVADTTYYTTDSFIADFSFENFIFGTDGYLKIDASFLPLLEMPNPLYCESTEMLELFLSTPLSLPEGNYSVTASLVTLDLADFDPIVSETVNFSFVTPTVATPIFTPAAGTYYSAQSVTIATETEDAQIYYTTNGDEPTTESALYSEAISINESTTLKAIAMKEGWNAGEVAEATYIISTNGGGMETFDNLSLEGSSYGNGEFTGQDGSIWSYEKARGDIDITGKAITIRNAADAYVRSGTLSHGITILNFDYMQAFGNNVNLAVYANDVLIGNVTSSNEQNIVKNSGDMPVNIEGDFVLKFENTGSSTGQVAIDNISWTPYVASNTVATPVITPNSGNYFAAQEVTIATATEGATIYYTTDGTDPDAVFSEYTVAFMISEEATVKAFAVKEGMDTSAIATAIYTFTLPTVVETIAELRDLAPSFINGSSNVGTTEYHFSGKAIVTFISSYRNERFMEDATGAIMIDDADGIITTAISVGDSITDVMGTLTNYRGLLQFVPVRAEVSVLSSDNAIPAPVVVTAVELKSNYGTYESRLVKIEAIVFTGAQTFSTSAAQSVNFRQGEETMICRNNFRTLNMSVAVNDTGSVIGFPVLFDTDYQVSPRTNADIELYEVPGQVATPIFTPAAGTYYTTQEVTVTTTTEGATIHYTTDGSTPTTSSTVYSSAISISESTILKAIAVKSDYTDSEIAVAEYVITAEPLAQVLLRPTHIDLTSTTSESAVLMNISGYNADALPRYRLYNSANQYNCWDAVTEEYITSSSYANGPLVPGDVSEGTTFWILFQRGNNATGTATYRDRLAPAYSGNYQTAALPAAASITSSFTLSGRFTGTAEYDNSQKYVVLAFSGTDLVSAAATVLSDGAFAVVCPEGTTIDKVELRTVDNILVISEIGTWTETVNLGSIPNNETQVSAPIFTPGTGLYYTSQQVTIETVTQGSTIYYTTDGTEPTTASTLYTSAITVSSTTTLKAIAVKDGLDNSAIITATYTFPAEVADIAAFKEVNTETNNTVYKIMNDVTFVFRSGAYMYVMDESGGLLIYDVPTVISSTYVEGDIISGGIYGTYTLYNGLVEMIPTLNTAPASGNTGTVEPVEVSMADLLSDYNTYESMLIRINDVIFEGGSYETNTTSNLTITQGSDEIICRSIFRTLNMTIEDGYNADVIGFPGMFNTTLQLAPRANSDIMAHTMVNQVATPTFSPNGGTYVSEVTVTISCHTDGATIYYTTDGSIPTTSSAIYTEPIRLTSSTTLSAFATKEGMINSSSVIAEYDITSGVNDLEKSNIMIYPVPARNSLTIETKNITPEKIEIFSYNGQILYTNTTPQSKEMIQIGDFSAGVYFVRITSGKEVTMRKFVKE